MNLFGKTVVLTGAGGGIGSVLAEKLHLEGARMFLIFREVRIQGSRIPIAWLSQKEYAVSNAPQEDHLSQKRLLPHL